MKSPWLLCLPAATLLLAALIIPADPFAAWPALEPFAAAVARCAPAVSDYARGSTFPELTQLVMALSVAGAAVTAPWLVYRMWRQPTREFIRTMAAVDGRLVMYAGWLLGPFMGWAVLFLPGFGEVRRPLYITNWYALGWRAAATYYFALIAVLAVAVWLRTVHWKWSRWKRRHSLGGH